MASPNQSLHLTRPRFVVGVAHSVSQQAWGVPGRAGELVVRLQEAARSESQVQCVGACWEITAGEEIDGLEERMETLSEAATLIESRGYLVERSPGAYPDGLLVAARGRYDDDDPHNDGTIWRYQGVFFLFPWRSVWVLVDVERGEEAEFGSLLEAVNVLLPRIRAWLVRHPE